MTRTARYNAETNTFRELPGLIKPVWEVTHWNYDDYGSALVAYDAHVAALRTIPGHESCRSVFKDQQVYEEDREYVIGVYPINEMRSDEPKYLAYPAPVKSEDEDKLWYQVKDLTLSAMDKNLSPEEWVGLMKGLYHITPR